jgi:hypothetical protein
MDRLRDIFHKTAETAEKKEMIFPACEPFLMFGEGLWARVSGEMDFLFTPE